MKAPPLLPEETLRRVLRVSHFHGTMVFFCSAVFALPSALVGDYPGTLVALVAAGAGAMEHHGSARLRHGHADGAGWLPLSQVVLFAAIAAYCLIKLSHVELPPLPDDMRPIFEANAQQVGMSVPAYLHLLYVTGFRVVLAVSAVYQGGMAFYYLRRRPALQQALAEGAEQA